MDLIFSFGSNEYSCTSNPVTRVSRGIMALDENLPLLTTVTKEFLPSTPAFSSVGSLLPVPSYSNALTFSVLPQFFSIDEIIRTTKRVEILFGRDRSKPRVSLDIDLVGWGSTLIRTRELPRPYCRIPLLRIILSGYLQDSSLHAPLFFSLFL